MPTAEKQIIRAILVDEKVSSGCVRCNTKRGVFYGFQDENKFFLLCRHCAGLITKQFYNYVKLDD